MLTPIVIFVYNRPEHTQRLLASLEACYAFTGADHPIFFFSDGPKNEEAMEKVEAVRTLLTEWKEKAEYTHVELRFGEKNKGLARSVISGVSEIIKEYGTVIVLEDDLVLAEDCLDFFQRGLLYYEKEEMVGAISGFSHPVSCTGTTYRSRTGNCWGWATWQSYWETVDWSVKDYGEFAENRKRRKEFDKMQFGISKMLRRQMHGEIDSWAVRWDYHFFKKGLWTIYPAKTRIGNEGFDGSGVHCGSDAIEEKPVFKDIKPSDKALFFPLMQLEDLTKVTAGMTRESLLDKFRRKHSSFRNVFLTSHEEFEQEEAPASALHSEGGM